MKYIFIILIIMLCAAPVLAITYPQEYYTLQTQSDSYEHYISDLIDNMSNLNNMWDAKTYLMLHYDLKRQNILLEKQNELQAELIKAQWVETCYSDYSGYGNVSAWKSECANAGYPVG
jgi:sugar diacid utilization regulator